jgi:hypothetical protein
MTELIDEITTTKGGYIYIHNLKNGRPLYSIILLISLIHQHLFLRLNSKFGNGRSFYDDLLKRYFTNDGFYIPKSCWSRISGMLLQFENGTISNMYLLNTDPQKMLQFLYPQKLYASSIVSIPLLHRIYKNLTKGKKEENSSKFYFTQLDYTQTKYEGMPPYNYIVSGLTKVETRGDRRESASDSDPGSFRYRMQFIQAALDRDYEEAIES